MTAVHIPKQGANNMDAGQRGSSSLFDVFLRLRPNVNCTERFLDVEDGTDGHNTHITIKPPENDYRKRAIEKFGFTKVFNEDASQFDIFNDTALLPLIEGVVGSNDHTSRDGLLATLGVTGSGKSHTILGSKTQRGLTQLSLDVLFKSIGNRIAHPASTYTHVAASDVAESTIVPATDYLGSIYGDGDSRATSRAPTPMLVSDRIPKTPSAFSLFRALEHFRKSPLRKEQKMDSPKTIKPIRSSALVTRSRANVNAFPSKENANCCIYPSNPSSSRRQVPRITLMPQDPNVNNLRVPTEEDTGYAIVISMYEVYNDRIFDLLTATANGSKTPAKDVRRRALLFKSTEYCPDRKVVAGLKKVVCGNMEEALLVLETGLTERRVAHTGSNAVSSRSHGFFCVEVKKRMKSRPSSWSGSTLTVVDLAGSERARAAKTQGNTLAEAGKINESLMYLGQCMQMQAQSSHDTHLVPFRQCKLTELLFSNYFPHTSSSLAAHPHSRHNHQQKAIMIVTADPRGDFNATSQILRYSALAREVTVPRIPSTTSTIITGSTACGTGNNSRPTTAMSSGSDHARPSGSNEEVSRLKEEMAVLQCQLEEETRRRQEAEDSWVRMEERLEEVEAEVREECWTEFEQRLVTERTRWAAAWDEERERNEGHLDRKLDLAMKGVRIYEDDSATEVGGVSLNADRVEELERENELMRSKLEAAEREKMATRTPSRKLKPLKTRKWNIDEDEENMTPGGVDFD